LKILSLFDGISCTYLALKRANIKIDKYYSSEINKYCLEISKKNFPDIIQLGDIIYWKKWDFKPGYFDLIVGGSPCQGFSVAGKQLSFKDPRSKLYFVFENIIKTLNPKYWVLENVRMKKEICDIISKRLGVNPVLINSALLSAQNRNRYYWANFKINQPNDKGILLKDIIHENTFVDNKKSHCLTSTYNRASYRDYLKKHSRQMVFDFNINPSGKGINGVVTNIENKSKTLTTNKGEGSKISISLNEYIVPFDKTLKIINTEIKSGKIGYFNKNSQSNRVYLIHNKAVTLCGCAGGGAAKMGQYLFGCITPDRINKRQNGQRFNNGKKFYTLTSQDKHGILIEGYIRKLTPIECERLQTLPDNFTFKENISNTQRYKMLGNCFTVDIIKHILENLKNKK
jgi:DNA-cytosine methyltransferase